MSYHVYVGGNGGENYTSNITRMLDAPIEALPRLVVHELMHLWLSQLEELARPLMAFTPPGADATFTEQWDRTEHQLIHVLEGALTGDAHLEWGEGAPDWTRPWQVAV